MSISIKVEKNICQIQMPIHTKYSQKARNRAKLPQLDKTHVHNCTANILLNGKNLDTPGSKARIWSHHCVLTCNWKSC